MNRSYDGKVVVITGAGTEVGATAAALFWNAGASVVLNALQGERLQPWTDRVGSDRMSVYRVDVLDKEHASAFAADAVDRFGKIDLLVNCIRGEVAGPRTDGWPDRGEGEGRRCLARILNSAIAFLPHLAETQGAIMNMLSVPASESEVGLVSSLQESLDNLTHALAIETAPKGVRVIPIAIVKSVEPSALSRKSSRSPMKRFQPAAG